MGRLLIVRHGETVWNHQGRIQGHTDVALSERGIRQAERLAARLAAEPIDAAYCSDLRRAAQTAEVILQGRGTPGLGLPGRPDAGASRPAPPLQPTPRLREYHKGAFEGLTDAEIRRRFPGQYPAYLIKDLDFAPEGGETVRAVSVRMASIINEIKARHLDETALVVGHGGSLRAALRTLLGMPPDGNWRFAFANCGLTIVETYADNAVLRLFNDTSHLASLGPALSYD